MMKKRLVQGIVWLVVLAVAVLFAMSLARDWANVRDTIASISLISWLSVVCFVLAVVVSGVLWGGLVAQMSGKEVALRDAVRIHAASWLLKYIPGQVGSLVNKLAWAKRYDYSKKTIGASVAYENILMVFASLLLSIPLVAVVDPRAFGDSTILFALLAVIPMLVVCNQKIFYTLISAALRTAKRRPIDSSSLLGSWQIFTNTLYYMIPRILNGVGFVIIASAMLPVTVDMYLPLASIFIFASIVGMLALFVPSGIGVREGIIVVLASVYFSPEQAIVLALVARFFTTIADIGVFGIYLILNRGRLTQR